MWYRRAEILRAPAIAAVAERYWTSWEYARLPRRYACTYSGMLKTKSKASPLQERRMVDRFRVWAKGGEGGNGCWSFHRSRSDRHGKPDGGNGGKGGDVILKCSSAVWDFSGLQHHLNAKPGRHGAPKGMIGSRGSNKVVQIPIGTVIHLVHGEVPSHMETTRPLDPWEISEDAGVELYNSSETIDEKSTYIKKPGEGTMHNENVGQSACTQHGLLKSSDPLVIDSINRKTTSLFNSGTYDSCEMEEDRMDDATDEEQDEVTEDVQYSVAELTIPGQQIIIARGGEGGLGSAFPRNDRHSRKERCNGNASDQDENQSLLAKGMPGSESVLILELKSIADVGLVGMPNAGKSTLLGAISKARPIVGDYAFTTLRPNLGNLNYEDFFAVTVADIPGLIKGAHENRGLGHAFLRHIERTKVLAYVVDLAAGLDGREGIPPWQQLRDLVLELEFHQEGMSKRPSLVVANKIDENGTEEILEELKARVRGVPIFPVSAILGEGIPNLKGGLRSLMENIDSQGLEVDCITVD